MRRDRVLKARSQRLRREATPAERILWGCLRGRRFARFKFRRQHPLGPYILDFYCAALHLCVELDGETHVGKEAKDEARQRWIEGQGVKVLRFWNPDVYERLDSVMETVWQECETRSQNGPLIRR